MFRNLTGVNPPCVAASRLIGVFSAGAFFGGCTGVSPGHSGLTDPICIEAVAGNGTTSCSNDKGGQAGGYSGTGQNFGGNGNVGGAASTTGPMSAAGGDTSIVAMGGETSVGAGGETSVAGGNTSASPSGGDTSIVAIGGDTSVGATGGQSPTGGTTSVSASGGVSPTGGTTSVSASGGVSPTGGTTSVSASGGVSPTGGTTSVSASGGVSPTGGTTSVSASGGVSPTGGTTSVSASGGVSPTGGTTNIGPSGGTTANAPDAGVVRPNILFIMADDLGYSDIHALGSEIDTPNLDELVANGRLLTNHHVGSVSAITRSMLISGTDHHLVGEGTMGAPMDERAGLPGYEGYLNDRSLSVADLLRDTGYHTYMAGKWHLGSGAMGSSTSQGKTPDQWGFEFSFALLPGGAGNHFAHEPAGARNFTSNGVYVQPGQPGQPGGYSTQLYTDQLISFIDSNRGDGKPFFAYAAYTAPHWPLAVPEPWLSQYRGLYDQGYAAIRNARLQRMKQLGIITDAMVPATPAPETTNKSDATANNGKNNAKYISAVHSAADGYVDYRAGVINKQWNSLSTLEQQAQARYMEIYAGMVANLDYNIGRLIEHLKDIGEYDRTLIVFHSDNGAEGWPIDSGNDPKATDEANARVLSTLGTDNGQQYAKMIRYGLRWGEVSATPYAQNKSQLGEGGVTTAAIVHLPGQVARLPNIDWFSHVTDDTATFLDAAGVMPPSEPAPPQIDPVTGVDANQGKVVYKGRYVYPVTGVSLLPALNDPAPAPAHSQPSGDESYGRAYLFSADGNWKARWTEPPFGPVDGHWELFAVATDRCETTDVSAQYPNVATQLVQLWQSYMTRVGGVEPLRPQGPY